MADSKLNIIAIYIAMIIGFIQAAVTMLATFLQLMSNRQGASIIAAFMTIAFAAAAYILTDRLEKLQ